jgi:hypothetical protein
LKGAISGICRYGGDQDRGHRESRGDKRQQSKARPVIDHHAARPGSARDDIAAGRLMPVLEHLNPGDMEAFHAVYVGQGGPLPSRVRALLDFLAEQGRSDEWPPSFNVSDSPDTASSVSTAL